MYPISRTKVPKSVGGDWAMQQISNRIFLNLHLHSLFWPADCPMLSPLKHVIRIYMAEPFSKKSSSKSRRSASTTSENKSTNASAAASLKIVFFFINLKSTINFLFRINPQVSPCAVMVLSDIVLITFLNHDLKKFKFPLNKLPPPSNAWNLQENYANVMSWKFISWKKCFCWIWKQVIKCMTIYLLQKKIDSVEVLGQKPENELVTDVHKMFVSSSLFWWKQPELPRIIISFTSMFLCPH